ncbi:MAG: 2-oxoacid:acceptor oxidoreductase family protein [Thermodesulfobacteriota bacterium]
MKHEIRLSGLGGQGLVLAGRILGEAATIHENLYAVQKQSYGPEARGGASRSDVIIADAEVDFPYIDEADILLTMSQEAYAKYAGRVRPEGILIVDDLFVRAEPKKHPGRFFSLDFTRLARNRLNNDIVANIIALGAVAGLLGVVSRDSLLKVIEKRVPSRFIDVNTEALDLGFSLIGEDKG